MKKLLKWSLVGGASLLTIVGAPAVYLMSSLGAFTSVDTTHAERCERITGMPGSEDIEPDYETGIAYISSDDRRAHMMGEDTPGSIFMINMSEGTDSKPIKMSGTEGLEPFFPHGMSLFKHDGRSLLFVISHRVPEQPSFGHDVFIFEIAGAHLSLIEKIEDDGLRSPNDIVAVGSRQFYFTNDRMELEGNSMLAEIALGRAASDVSYYDGNTSKVVASGIALANGINANSDRSKIYASAGRSGLVNIYDRDLDTNDLTLVRSVETGNGPDNITVDRQGNLWIAEHPNMLAFQAHRPDVNSLSPVRIYKVDPVSFEGSAVYQDSGSNISAVSVAVPFQDKLFLGAVFDDGVALCQF